MTKRRKHRRSHKSVALTPYRHRKTHKSMLSGFDATSLLAVAGGGAVAGLLNKVIPATWDPKIGSIGKIGVGALLPMLSKEGKTKQMLSHFGEGFVAVGTYELLRSFGVISGLGQTELADDDLLAVSLEGIGEVEFEDIDEISEDVLNGGDLNVVNDDVLNGGDLNVVNGDLDQTY